MNASIPCDPEQLRLLLCRLVDLLKKQEIELTAYTAATSMAIEQEQLNLSRYLGYPRIIESMLSSPEVSREAEKTFWNLSVLADSLTDDNLTAALFAIEQKVKEEAGASKLPARIS